MPISIRLFFVQAAAQWTFLLLFLFLFAACLFVLWVAVYLPALW